MRRLLLYSALLLPLAASAQSWEFEAPVTQKGSGYQDILLPAEVTAHLNPEGSNLRLLDSSDNEVPFILNQEPLRLEETRITWMPNYQDDYWERWYSRSFFQNPRQLALDRIVLKIRNADVHQSFWLSGSDDMNRWYIIKDNYDYNANYDPQSTWNLLTIHFPPTDYKYYKVELRHYWHEPIQIMGAGYYSSAERNGDARNVPDPVITQREEGSTSYVDLQFDAAHYFDEMLFEVDGPERYLRHCQLQRKTASGSFETVKNLDLSSKFLNVTELEHLRGAAWRLVIENKDDKPIRIAGIQARQRQLSLTAQLLPTTSYRLALGDEGLRAPEYDLGYFKDDLPTARTRATLGALQDLKAPASAPQPLAATGSSDQAIAPAPTPETKPLHQQPWFLWTGILLVVAIVGGMSLKLLKDVKREGE